ncbi:MAG: ribosome biogenesis GTPase Der [Rhodospirillaceae bacterium]|nr:ribosome biogenesis GTPase Der [Rhodospirillaceae bacterium]HAA92908.1 ribosome biogenesis GTPase Der [Rhodospirillaceae bacterium]
MTISVAIIGRPNTGKSTLFNRLVGKRLALVDDQPGVTRDRREGEAELGDLSFRIIDTAGLDNADAESLAGRMQRQTEQAVAESNVVLMLVDARAGITALDRHFADWVRGQSVPVILAANKCEGGGGEAGRLEAFELGLGEPIAVSAEHGEGLGELYGALQPIVDADAIEGDEEAAPEVQLAIVGRPNTGKSTLVNQLLGQDRLLTGPEAGITRDSIAIDWEYDNRPLKLIDTAGLRRRARVDEKLEKLSARDTARAIQFSQVVVLMLDGQTMLERQDLTIARQVIDEGRALIIAVNKWDLVKTKKAAMRKLEDRLETSLTQVRGIPVVTLSALEGTGIDKLMAAVFEIYQVWNRRIATARLNDWLAEMVELHPPPLASTGRRVRLRYMTQTKTRPPTFAVWVSRPKDLPEAYSRYLVNGLRDDFGLIGVPLRITLRQGKNPYVKET